MLNSECRLAWFDNQHFSFRLRLFKLNGALSNNSCFWDFLEILPHKHTSTLRLNRTNLSYEFLLSWILIHFSSLMVVAIPLSTSLCRHTLHAFLFLRQEDFSRWMHVIKHTHTSLFLIGLLGRRHKLNIALLIPDVSTSFYTFWVEKSRVVGRGRVVHLAR